MGPFLLNFCRERLVKVATFVVVTKLGSHPPTYPKFILYRYRNNHSTNKSCLPSLIPQKSRSSAFVQSEERSQPLPLWPPRSVHWVCLPKKLVTISQRPPKNGKVSLSCNFCGSDLKVSSTNLLAESF